MGSTDQGAPASGRFRVTHLLLVVAVSAVFFTVARRSDLGSLLTLIPAGLGLAWGLAWALPARDAGQRRAIHFVLLGVASQLVVIAQGLSRPGLTGQVVMLLTSVVTALVVALAYLAWRASAGRTSRRSEMGGWLLLLGFVVGPFVTTFSQWPARVGFRLSEPALDRLADRVAAGEPVRWPEQAGTFRIVRAVVDPATGNVGLVLIDNPSGAVGLLRQGPSSTRYGPFYNHDGGRPLGGRWWIQEED